MSSVFVVEKYLYLVYFLGYMNGLKAVNCSDGSTPTPPYSKYSYVLNMDAQTNATKENYNEL